MKKTKLLSLLTITALLLTLAFVPSARLTYAEEPAAESAMTPGTYTATVAAMHGLLTMELDLSETAITDVRIVEQRETPGIGDVAADLICQAIVEQQSLDVDSVAGATITSAAVLQAAKDCLAEAGVDPEELPGLSAGELRADVVIVGGGGAGLAAAVEALDTDPEATVILIEKMGFLGGNSIVAGGIYNAPSPEWQDHHFDERSESLESLITAALAEDPVNEEHAELIALVQEEYEEYLESDKTLFDSANWFALQTWNGGDKIAELWAVKYLTAHAAEGLDWYKSLGMEFRDGISHGGGSLYPRTHTAVLPNGTGYIYAMTGALAGNENYTELLNTNAVSLILDGERVVGVNAETKDGENLEIFANRGVILTTGGFAGNVELRQEYCEGEKWPDLGPGVPTSNMAGVTGDGIFMARDAGANLVNMDQIQLLPYCHPQTGATYDIVSTGRNVFINKEGERFVREDGRRDEMSKAIIAQTDGVMYLLNSLEGIEGDYRDIKALGGQTLGYYLDSNYGGYVFAETLEELAELLDVPADALVQSIEEYNAHVESDTADEFGRVSHAGVLRDGPFFAYPRKPAVHHTMGGVQINEQGQALGEDGNPIAGLYCAGEITGVVHGGNRLGGNALVDFTVFGRLAGREAVSNK